MPPVRTVLIPRTIKLLVQRGIRFLMLRFSDDTGGAPMAQWWHFEWVARYRKLRVLVFLAHPPLPIHRTCPALDEKRARFSDRMGDKAFRHQYFIIMVTQ